MKRTAAVLILESDRVELVTVQGRSAGTVHTLADQLDLADDGLRTALRKLKPALAAAVSAQGLKGCRCLVYYRSAAAAVHLVSSPTKSRLHAEEAARLALGDALGYPADVAVTDAAFVCRDNAGKSAHALAVGDRAQTIAAISDLVRGAELNFEAAVPIDAPLHAALIRRAAAHADAEPTALLHLGLHASALAVAEGGMVKLFRPLAFTAAQLIAALQKPLTASSAESACDGVERDTVIGWLSRFGIPDREETVDDDRGITGAHVRPVLQPILQRLVTEIRQSIRFGVDEQQRLHVQLEVDGAARNLRNLSAALHHELNLPVEVDNATEQPESDFFSPTRDLCARDAANPALRLLPDELDARLKLSRFKRRLWSGAAAAGLLLALDAGLLHQKITDAERALLPLEAIVSEQARADGMRTQVYSATEASFGLENDVVRHLSNQPAVSALLRSLAEVTPPRVRLLNVELRAEADEPTALIEGYADTGGRGGGEIIRGYIADLAALPGIGEAALSNVQETTIDGAKRHQFRLALRLQAPLRPLRSGRVAEQLAGRIATGEENTP